jgi:hypothetical protein
MQSSGHHFRRHSGQTHRAGPYPAGRARTRGHGSGGLASALGKLEADPDEVLAGIEPAGFNHLSIVGGHAAKVANLPPIHKDPFDRLLVAQARFEPMILLTDDDVLGGYGDFVEVI